MYYLQLIKIQEQLSNMQDNHKPHPSINNQLAQRLLKLSRDKLDLQEYLKILEKENKLTYLKCNQFCRKIKELIDNPQADRFIRLFRLQFVNNRQKQDKYGYHFPFINHEEKFTKHILHTFVIEYLQDQTTKSDQYDQKRLKQFSSFNSEKNYWNPDEKDQMHQEQFDFVGNIVYFDNLDKLPNPNQIVNNKQNDVKNTIAVQQNQQPKLKQKPQQPLLKQNNHQEKVQNMYLQYHIWQDQKEENKRIFKFNFVSQFDNLIPNQNVKENFNPSTNKQLEEQKSKQIENKINSYNNCEKFIIPKYFMMKNKAVSTLLALDFTDYFIKQLEQVKKLLKSHIYKLPFYQEFYRQYRQYRSIVDGDFESQLKDTKIQRKRCISQIRTYFEVHNKTIKYLSSKKKSILMKTWQIIFQRLQQKQSNEIYDFQQKVNRFLQQGIGSIFLIFKLNNAQKNVYGFTKDMLISININFLPERQQIKQYREGVMKPYIAFTAYHELAHYLIRAFNKEEHEESGQSFGIAFDSLGKQILDLILEAYKKVPAYLKIKLIKQANQINIINIAQNAYRFLTFQQKELIEEYEKKAEQFNILLQKIETIKSMIQNFPKNKSGLTIDQDSWCILEDYISQLQRNDVEISREQNDTDEFKYSIFFSYFLLQRVMKNIVQRFNKKKKKYEELCNTIKKLKNKLYFLKRNKVIDLFCSLVIQQREKKQYQKKNLAIELQNKKIIIFQAQYISFIQIMLKQGLAINQEIQDLCNTFGQQTLKKYFSQFYQFIKLNQMTSIFKNFALTKYQQLNKYNTISDLLDNPPSFNSLVDLYESYEMMMNLIKYNELLTIIYQTPSFFSHDAFEYLGQQGNQANEKHTNSISRYNLESGYDIQRRMFPQLIQSQTIYSKDYQLMRDIENDLSRLEIGKRPKNPDEQHKKIAMKSKFLDNGFSLKSARCGNELMNEARLKKQSEIKDAKRIEQFLKSQLKLQ